MCNNKMFVIGILLALSTYVSAFFFSWGSTDQQSPNSRYVYHKRLLQGPAYLVDPDKRPLPPSVLPLQVPLQAQLSPLQNIQNVQLVPCLCPVTPDVVPYEPQPQHAQFENHHHLQQQQQQQIQQQQIQQLQQLQQQPQK